MKNNTPVPVEAVLQSISKILHENIGSRFDLEITEKDSEGYCGNYCHRIEINLTVEEPIPPKKNGGVAREKEPEKNQPSQREK